MELTETEMAETPRGSITAPDNPPTGEEKQPSTDFFQAVGWIKGMLLQHEDGTYTFREETGYEIPVSDIRLAPKWRSAIGSRQDWLCYFKCNSETNRISALIVQHPLDKKVKRQGNALLTISGRVTYRSVPQKLLIVRIEKNDEKRQFKPFAIAIHGILPDPNRDLVNWRINATVEEGKVILLDGTPWQNQPEPPPKRNKKRPKGHQKGGYKGRKSNKGNAGKKSSPKPSTP